ncbi:MAG: GDP-mannose 4,6-dehydratase [bacterium]|nr:GDP-mannose 4,6-dehydratase [bacterium]MDD5354486.1 GDP-mannose 4,6-dehydratase [bacterium]
MMAQKRALITGGAGFIGSHLSEELLDRGFRVTVIDDLSTGRKENIAHLLKNIHFKFYKNTIMNEPLMARLVRNCDIVYHMAAAVGVKYILDNPIQAIVTNVTGTEKVIRLADKYHKKMILASTSEIYGKTVDSASRETDDRLVGPTSVNRWSYSNNKALDEFLALAYYKERKLPVVIVRLFNCVGPRQLGRYGMVLPRFIQSALDNRPITVYGDGSQSRTFTYVKDVVWAIATLSLAKKAEGKIFNVGNDHAITINDLAKRIKKQTGSRSKIVHISYAKAFGKMAADFEDMGCRIPDITRIKKTIKYSPCYNIDRIIENTINHFNDQRKTHENI